MRQGEHNSPSAGNCPAKRTPSRSRASPHCLHNVAVCTATAPKQSSQTGESPARSSGPPQTLQSAGNKVVTKSSTTARTTRPGFCRKRVIALPSATLASKPGGVPGGPPALLPSALSFKHSLKTHLTRRRSRSVGPRHARSIRLSCGFFANRRTTLDASLPRPYAR